jgi:hypothetical protein
MASFIGSLNNVWQKAFDAESVSIARVTLFDTNVSNTAQYVRNMSRGLVCNVLSAERTWSSINTIPLGADGNKRSKH